MARAILLICIFSIHALTLGPVLGANDQLLTRDQRAQGWLVWRSANSRHQCVAKKLSLTGIHVWLLKTDGKMVQVPLQKLDGDSRLQAVDLKAEPGIGAEPARIRPAAPPGEARREFNPLLQAAKERRRYRRKEALAMRRQLYGGRRHVYTISVRPPDYGWIPTIRNPPPPISYRRIRPVFRWSRAAFSSYYPSQRR